MGVAWAVRGQHPSIEIFDSREISRADVELFVGIIVTEGVPHALKDFPLVFEAARKAAATHLNISSKAISLTGSARLGYSTAPAKFGNAFSVDTSDLDLMAIDEKLFELFAAEHGKFLADWRAGRSKPRNADEEAYWSSSRALDPANIRKGFLDGNHVPYRYPVSGRIQRAGTAFSDVVRREIGSRVGKRSSFRIYRDWKSVIQRNSYNLRSALKAKGVRILD
jgi:hypothetical protein